MIYLTVTFCCGILLACGIIAIRKSFYSLIEKTVALSDAMLMSSENESLKQKTLLKSMVGAISSIYKFIFLAAVTIAVSAIPIVIFTEINGLNIFKLDYLSTSFYIPLTIGSIIPFVIFSQFFSKSDYSELSVLTHKILLDNHNFSKALFALEKILFIGRKKELNEEFFVISGLARAGTTALTNVLFDTGKFHSLTYRNMPALLSPKIWSFFHRTDNKKMKERSHGDGVMVGKDSVEALDEYFWKAQMDDSYIQDSELQAHQISDETYNDYLKYQHLVKKDKFYSLYLTKNNNFMLRYEAMRKHNKQFKVLLMFRDPVDHALSLQNQHRRYKYMQQDDPFILDYMNWIGHHEFGRGQKSFRFGQLKKVSSYEKDALNFWMDQWVNYYNYVLQQLDDENLILIDYLDFLSEPHETITSLEKELKLTLPKDHVSQFINRGRELDEAVDPQLGERAYAIFNQLKEHKVPVRRTA